MSFTHAHWRTVKPARALKILIVDDHPKVRRLLVDRLSVSQKISELTDRLEAEGRFTFTSMFSFLLDGVARSARDIRHEAVVTFLALLEMAKLRLLALTQPDGDEIIIERNGDDLRARVEASVARGDEYR